MAGITWTDWYGDGSLVVVDAALACCTLEFEEAARGRTSGSELIQTPPGSRCVLVVSGTVTDRLVPALLAVLDACRQRDPDCRVVAFGACTASGGPYWDSYAVLKGIGQLVEVDAYVAGCPPPPAALESVLERWRATPSLPAGAG